MKVTIKALALALCAASLISCSQQPKSNTDRVTIGIIEPIEHKAMNEIVAGFSNTLKTLYKQPVVVTVENAQADPNLERAIIQKMNDANYSFILPIGEDATQMTLAMAKDAEVVSLASDLSDADRQKMQPCHVAVVHDEISSDQIMQFVHTVYPNIKNLTLIHSSANKVFPEVKDAVAAGKKYGITITPKMISSLAELYTVGQSISAKTQGIFVLKDSLVVSGVATLQKLATEKHIPLITSDQGSVQDGAGFALGVHESQIGVEGAKLVAAVLNGKSICSLPIVNMEKLTVFINKNSLQQEQQLVEPIQTAAATLHYQVETAG